MTKNSKNTYDKALIEASQWIAREGSGDMTSSEKAELENWLADNIDHQDAYLANSKTAELFDSISSHDRREELRMSAPEFNDLLGECEDLIMMEQVKYRRPINSFGWVATIAASVLMIAVSAILIFNGGSMATIYQTNVGDNETIMLNDGSIITLNTDTRISVALSDTERRILLEHGEAYFAVAKDNTRPFTVVIGDDIIRAVGTAFNIKRREEITKVTVTEGIVEVKTSAPTGASDKSEQISAPVSMLNVGEKLTIDQQGSRAIMLAPIDLEHTISWRTGMLHFNGERLGTVVREIQYYASKEIILASNQVSDLIVGGSFNTKNVTSFLKGLELTFPIKVIERDSVIIISYEKKQDDILSVSNW